MAQVPSAAPASGMGSGELAPMDRAFAGVRANCGAYGAGALLAADIQSDGLGSGRTSSRARQRVGLRLSSLQHDAARA